MGHPFGSLIRVARLACFTFCTKYEIACQQPNTNVNFQNSFDFLTLATGKNLEFVGQLTKLCFFLPETQKSSFSDCRSRIPLSNFQDLNAKMHMYFLILIQSKQQSITKRSHCKTHLFNKISWSDFNPPHHKNNTNLFYSHVHYLQLIAFVTHTFLCEVLSGRST